MYDDIIIFILLKIFNGTAHEKVVTQNVKISGRSNVSSLLEILKFYSKYSMLPRMFQFFSNFFCFCSFFLKLNLLESTLIKKSIIYFTYNIIYFIKNEYLL